MDLHQRVRYWYRLLHRYNPFRAEVGLRAIGNPDADSPVLVSGNYEHTVEQLEEVLVGQNCWLLVADSAGINVWCGAGVGDFNENKITDAVVATGLADKVRHRRLIVSPLAAVGIHRKRLLENTGFSVVWGPAHLDDLPRFLGNNCVRDEGMRLARFPWRDRWENAVGMMGVFLLPSIFAWWWPRRVAWFLFSLAHAIFGSVLFYDRLPPKYPANKTLLLGLGQALTLWAGDRWLRRDARLGERLVLGALAHFLIAIDMIGSTPFYKTTIVHWLKTGANRSLFQPVLNGQCTSCGQCLEVCPKGIFSRTPERRISVNLDRECCECMACLKQCPFGAIDNQGSGFKDDIKSLDVLPRLRPPTPQKG